MSTCLSGRLATGPFWRSVHSSPGRSGALYRRPFLSTAQRCRLGNTEPFVHPPWGRAMDLLRRPPTARGRAEEAFLSCPLHPAGRLQVSPSAPPSSTSNDCQHRSRLERRLAPRYLRPGPRGGKRGTSLRFNPTRMTGSHPLTRRRSGSAIPRSTIDEDPPTAPLAQHAPTDILWQDGPATNRRPPAVAPAR
jgi:hypothetical protein